MVDREVRFEIHRDDGQVFVIDDYAWRIPEDGLSGWHSMNVDVATLDNVSRDGGIITNQRVGMVDRTIVAEIRRSSSNASARRFAERFFLPKRKYTVYATYMGRTRKCEGVQAGFALTEYNVYDPVRLTWTIFCPNPYMQAVEPVKSTDKLPSIPASGMPYMVSGNFAYLDTTKVAVGFHTGFGQKYTLDYDVVNKPVQFIENIGDLPVMPRFEFTVDRDINLKLDLQIWLLKIEDSTDGVPRFKRDGRTLHLSDIDWGVPSGTFYWTNFPLIIDLNSRPFRVVNDTGHSFAFKLEEDSLLRDPYMDAGVWAFEYKLVKSVTPSDYKEVKMEASLQPQFTGV